ncbi:MAG: M6 family metalloprotease domain-containing protein [candidate division WOR-3 bacterium]|nr:MAG: M6 family metalloprotease domain-containing protein [candidate division WOR-3 bacterium]
MKYLMIALAFVLFVSSAAAVPMSPQLKARLDSEGTLEQVVEILKDAKERGFDEPNPSPFRSNRARADTIKAIVILVDFSDNIGTTPVAHYDSLLSSCGCFPTGSMRDYYLEISYGSVEFITTIVGWFRMPQAYTYYTNNNYGFGGYPMNAQRMTEDAVWAADTAVDFSEFDNDDDGYVDALFVVHAGPGAEVTGSVHDIWSHASTTVNVPYVDGVYAWRYSTEPEDGAVGVFAHEAGHAIFGLPDLYDYDYDSEGVGSWSLMAGGSWNLNGYSPAHMDAYSKVRSGFVEPQVVTTNMDSVIIPNVTYNPVIFKMWRNGSPGSQYFLVENRQWLGFDNYLPWEGLLIYHVDENMPNNNHQWYPGYTNYGHYKVALEQSDGEWQMEQNINAGNHGDPYPGVMPMHFTFNDTTVPDSKDYDFISTYVAVENVSFSEDTMTADLKVLPTGIQELTEPALVNLQFQVSPVISKERFQISFGAIQDYGQARVEIYDATGRLIKSFAQLVGGSVSWFGEDDSGQKVAPGAYFVKLEAARSGVVLREIQKIIFIK